MENTVYFEPSPLMRELCLLECLDTQPRTSQSSLAVQVGLTPAMVNAYIRRFQREGLVKTEALTRGLAYHLTPAGRQRLNYHRVTYRAELVGLIQGARRHFQDFFRQLAVQQVRRVVLYGAGETAEVVLDALEGTPILGVLAIVDDAPTKQGGRIRGVPIIGVHQVAAIQPDALVITSVVFDRQIRERVAASLGPDIRVFSLTE